MVIHGDHRQPSKIADTLIRGFHNMKISQPQHLGADPNQANLEPTRMNLVDHVVIY
jgi:hypothetical protein